MNIAEHNINQNKLNNSYYQNYNNRNSIMILQHKYFNICAFAIILVLFSFSVQCKTTRKNIPIYQLATQSQTAYISRFGLSTAGGQIVIKLNKYGEEFPELTNLKLGLLLDEDFYAHKNAQGCEQKQQYYKQTFRLKFFSPTQGMSSIPISKNSEEHLYFFYIYTCDFVDADKDNQSMLGIDLIMTNNGLGMSEYGGTFWPYLIMAALCVGLSSRYYQEVLQFIKMNKNLSSVLMCIGYMIGSLAIISKFFNSASNLMTEDESQFFSALYNTLKVFQEVTMATVLVSIAWGWLLNHQDNKKFYYVIVGGVTLMNFLSEVISLFNKEQVTNQNLYQGAIGKFALILRIIICVIFVSGCLYVSIQTIPKRQKFINTYAEIGAIYLLTNLISLLCSSIFAHAYNHGQTIPTLEDILRFSCIVYLCYLFAYPKQVSYEQIGFGIQFDDDNNSLLEREDFFFDPKSYPASVGSIMQPVPLINLQQPPVQKKDNQVILEQPPKIQYQVEHTKFDSDQNENQQKNTIPNQSGSDPIQKKHENQIQQAKGKRITVGNTGAVAKPKNKTKVKKNKIDMNLFIPTEHPVIDQPVNEPTEILAQQPQKQSVIEQKNETVQQAKVQADKDIRNQEPENKKVESHQEEISDDQV